MWHEVHDTIIMNTFLVNAEQTQIYSTELAPVIDIDMRNTSNKNESMYASIICRHINETRVPITWDRARVNDFMTYPQLIVAKLPHCWAFNQSVGFNAYLAAPSCLELDLIFFLHNRPVFRRLNTEAGQFSNVNLNDADCYMNCIRETHHSTTMRHTDLRS